MPVILSKAVQGGRGVNNLSVSRYWFIELTLWTYVHTFASLRHFHGDMTFEVAQVLSSRCLKPGVMTKLLLFLYPFKNN
jgi:hypothetical protein